MPFEDFNAKPAPDDSHSLAYAEMKLVLANLVYNFDFELKEHSDDWKDQKVFTVWDKKPLEMLFSERD